MGDAGLWEGDSTELELIFQVTRCGCCHLVVPVVLSASRKKFGVLVKRRKVDNKR